MTRPALLEGEFVIANGRFHARRADGTMSNGREPLDLQWNPWPREERFRSCQYTAVSFGYQEQTRKIRNLAANPHVTLALPDSQDVVVIEGDAEASIAYKGTWTRSRKWCTGRESPRRWRNWCR